MRLVRYRFKTKSVDDYRPLIDMKNIQMPWWCSGEADDGSYAIIICYLPENEELEKYNIEALKNLVDKMFKKYGEEEDNMIAVWDANVVSRNIWEGEDPISDIYWEGFEHKYNKLYYPICSNDENVPDEYYKDIDKLTDILYNLKIKDAYDYWENDNGALNECWYGVIGIMKNYRVVAFVIRDDGMLCDQQVYISSNNKIIKTF